MAERAIGDQVVKYLADVHSIEEQALTQMRQAPKLAGDPELRAAFQQHLAETERHETMVAERLEALGASPSRLKDVAGKAGGGAMVLFAWSQPDTPGKLVAHAYAYEHMELAAYELLLRVAERASDEGTAALARDIREEEGRMAERLQTGFDGAVEASLGAVSPDSLDSQLDRYLADAHAIEMQALQLLEKAAAIGGDPPLAAAYAEHLRETREHERRLRERLEARGGGPSTVKDAALRLGAVNIGLFFQVQPDTPAKLAGFAFAFEHLEVAAYELLARVADRAGDGETARAAREIVAEERGAAEAIASHWDGAMDAALVAVGARA